MYITVSADSLQSLGITRKNLHCRFSDYSLKQPDSIHRIARGVYSVTPELFEIIVRDKIDLCANLVFKRTNSTETYYGHELFAIDDTKVVEQNPLCAQQRHQNKLIREKNELKNIINAKIEEAYSKSRIIEPIEISPKIKCSGKTTTALFSDLHLGSKQHNQVERINKETLTIRFYKYVEVIIDELQNSNSDFLNMLIIGDMVEGNKIFPKQDYEIEMTEEEQAILVADLILEAIITIQKIIPTIQIRVVFKIGNHGRVDKYRPYAENVDGRVSLFVQRTVQDRGLQKITVYNEYGTQDFGVEEGDCWTVFKLGGVNYLLGHGDFVKGAKTYLARFMDKVKDIKHFVKEEIPFAIIGHFHTVNITTFRETKLMINGSFKGYDNYLKRLVMNATPPSQIIFTYVTDKPSDCIIRIVELDQTPRIKEENIVELV